MPDTAWTISALRAGRVAEQSLLTQLPVETAGDLVYDFLIQAHQELHGVGQYKRQVSGPHRKPAGTREQKS